MGQMNRRIQFNGNTQNRSILKGAGIFSCYYAKLSIVRMTTELFKESGPCMITRIWMICVLPFGHWGSHTLLLRQIAFMGQDSMPHLQHLKKAYMVGACCAWSPLSRKQLLGCGALTE